MSNAVTRARPGTGGRTSAVTMLIAAVGVVVTVALFAAGQRAWEYRSPASHLVLETVDACVAVLVSYLVYGRFRRSGSRQDLLLLQGFASLGLANACLALTLAQTEWVALLGLWLPPPLRVLGALLIAAAALLPRRSARSAWRRWLFAPLLGVVLVIVLVVLFQRENLPGSEQVAGGFRPPISSHGHPALLITQVVSLLAFAAAAVAFMVEARKRDDVLMRWLGPACALGALARANYLIFPASGPDWVYSGDVLRTGCYFLLLVGAGREISRYWGAQAEAAVAEDRRRVAREMHDGVLQELGYIRSELAAFASVDEERVGRIVASSDRALDEARQMLVALGRAGDEPLADALERAVEQIAERYGVALALELDASITADTEQRHALVRVAREAVLNAVRHGQAERIRVRLAQEGKSRLLEVTDDGTGFDPARRTSGRQGFGLTSMRERAEALPGVFRLESTPGDGTTVQVRW
ncbi:sensor histidine kinase [Kribbella ginsengisoli]|uniref:Histidine kinase domain-containing protein n=1 Tax=Kribbella ginsengisoli TaxID=363865 RepID=A0ABP6XM69_9ACTN